jgi:truncated hemoglobin YjbI
MNIWHIIKSITETKEDLDFANDEVKKEYKIYNINKILSFVKAEIYISTFLKIINEINKYRDIPKEVHFNYFKVTLLQQRQWFEYLKKAKDDINQETKDLIMQYYNISKSECENYLDILNKEQINKIVETFDGGILKRNK